MNIPEISVVMPAYNAGKYLAESIESVIKQSFESWELIVVDDGSNDNTAEVANSFLSDQRILLIRQLNKGVSAARNAGIKAANGRFITFLDADDYYLPDNLQEKYDVLIKDTSIDFVYSDVMQCDEELNDVKVEKGVETENLFQKVLQWQGETIPTLPSNIMVKRALMKGKFLFDENLSNCADRYMKILLSKDKLAAYIPNTLVKYRNTPGSMSKKVWLLEHDEEYIANQIKEQKIIPRGMFRNKVISNMYYKVSGSWHTDAHNSRKALKYAIKAILIYPPITLRFINKGVGLFIKKR